MLTITKKALLTVRGGLFNFTLEASTIVDLHYLLELMGRINCGSHPGEKNSPFN